MRAGAICNRTYRIYYEAAARADRSYAHQAKDRELIEHATDIRMRAEIRAGEMLRGMKKNKGARSDGRPSKIGDLTKGPPKDTTPTLADLDIDKHQFSRWQKLAALSEAQQEEKIAIAKRKAE